MTKKSNKSDSIIFTQNPYTEEQNEYYRILQARMFYFRICHFEL